MVNKNEYKSKARHCARRRVEARRVERLWNLRHSSAPVVFAIDRAVIINRENLQLAAVVASIGMHCQQHGDGRRLSGVMRRRSAAINPSVN